MADSSYYILYVTLFFLSIVLLRNLLRRPSKSLLHGRPPPSPPALPLIGHLHYFSPYVSKSFHNLVTRYGDLLFLRLGNIRCLVVASATYAEEIYKIQDVTFSSRPKFAFGDELPYANAGFFGAEYGGYWRFMKKLTMTELLSQRQVERSRGVRRDEMVKFLVKLAECGERNDAVDLGAELIRLANNSICRLLMSTRCCGNDDEAETIRTLVRETMEVATKVSFGNVFGGPLEKLAFWLFGRQVRDLTLRYDEILEKVLKQHEHRAKEDDFDREDRDLMDILLRVYRDENSEFKITRTHIKAFFLDLLLGGTGTSTEVAQWVMSELLNHPKVFNKLRNEIDSVIGTTKLVGEDDVPNLPYLQAVVKETLRLYPAVPIAMRACRQDCKINGFDVPKDTMVAVNLFTIMRDPKVWENPNEFDPERFTGEERYEIKGQQSFKFVPFGGGRRACPGSTLAFGFISTVVAAMVQCFDWKIGRNGDESKVDMEIGAAFTLPRANPLLCVPVLRFDPSSLAKTTY
ncbi:cytochrome P450 705A22-like [Cucurbita pepo subsp. pepo]|uniref:cytochrome P450 705A22-like n=1 Tax=Cucurbita pepo subsp. pepo TaxID=3664 RepID=UPI000C9D448F|nr:cytochrome P450 705A22-like [Cucurbita pepo subsp. pepo]